MLSRQEAEDIYEEVAIEAASPSSARLSPEDTSAEEAGSSHKQLSLDLLSAALDQVGQRAAQKLTLLAQAPPTHQSLALTEAAIYNKLRSTHWLVNTGQLSHLPRDFARVVLIPDSLSRSRLIRSAFARVGERPQSAPAGSSQNTRDADGHAEREGSGGESETWEG